MRTRGMLDLQVIFLAGLLSEKQKEHGSFEGYFTVS